MSFWKKRYEEAEPMPVKFLHSDGTIDDNPGITPEISSLNLSGTDITEENLQPLIDKHLPFVVEASGYLSQVNSFSCIGSFGASAIISCSMTVGSYGKVIAHGFMLIDTKNKTHYYKTLGDMSNLKLGNNNPVPLRVLVL